MLDLRYKKKRGCVDNTQIPMIVSRVKFEVSRSKSISQRESTSSEEFIHRMQSFYVSYFKSYHQGYSFWISNTQSGTRTNRLAKNNMPPSRSVLAVHNEYSILTQQAAVICDNIVSNSQWLSKLSFKTNQICSRVHT